MNAPKTDLITEKLRNLAFRNSQKYPSANKREIASRVSREFRLNRKEIERFFSNFFIDDYEFFALKRPKKRRH